MRKVSIKGFLSLAQEGNYNVLDFKSSTNKLLFKDSNKTNSTNNTKLEIKPTTFFRGTSLIITLTTQTIRP